MDIPAARSSRGLGRSPLKAEISGSNPLRATRTSLFERSAGSAQRPDDDGRWADTGAVLFRKVFLGLLAGGSVLAIALPNERGRIIEFMTAILTLALAGGLFWWIARQIRVHWRGVLRIVVFLVAVLVLPLLFGSVGSIGSLILLLTILGWGLFKVFRSPEAPPELSDFDESREERREPSLLGMAITQGMKDGGGASMFNQSREDEDE